MSGTVTVTKTRDWLTPFTVALQPGVGEGQPSTTRFAAASRAQEYALAMAREWEAILVYTEEADENLDVLGVPTNGGNRKTSREISALEFQQRFQRICNKCKQAKPLTAFGSVMHRNRTTGREVFHGYTGNCLDCGGGA